MKFKQIPNNFPIENKESFLVIFIMALTVVMLLFFIQRQFQTPVIVLILVLFLCVFLTGRSRRLFSDWTREKDIIGEINFEENVIKLNKNASILHDDIKYIHFQFNYIKGRQYTPKDVVHNGLTALHITTKDTETRTIKFVIETKEQFEFLKPMFKKWYQSGIGIKEEFGDMKLKTICLKPLAKMSYKDIQALKEEIKPHTS